MDLLKYFLCFVHFLLFFTGFHGWVEAAGHDLYGYHPTKLFVFGDSYADTGNNRKPLASSWKVPYGITFPGKPAGRFSDGRVLTDYVARFMGIKSPIPYRWRRYGGKHHLRNGMNFAYGGTGVFDTLVTEPNMTAQIGFFQQLVRNDSPIYTDDDLKSSLALVSLAGNDYAAYLARGGKPEGFTDFITRVVSQLTLNLESIRGLGVRKIAVTSLEPLGCLPRTTIQSSFQKCNETVNTAANFHNLLLQQAVAGLNNQSNDSSFLILDLYASFTTVLNHKKGQFPAGGLKKKFETPLKPCCRGVSNEYSCGEVDEKGRKLYRVCNNPKSAFFWDTVHPTQAGWRAVYLALKHTLHQIDTL